MSPLRPHLALITPLKTYLQISKYSHVEVRSPTYELGRGAGWGLNLVRGTTLPGFYKG